MRFFNQSWGWLDPVRRLLWLPVVVGVLAGFLVGSFTGATTEATTAGVLNTRAAASLPNERVDLINDLVATSQLSSITNPVARANDLSGAALRAGLSVERIEASTLVRVTLTAEGDDEFRRGVLQDFLDEVRTYLTPERPSPAYQAALEEEDAAIDAYYQAIADNNGLNPVDTLERLQTNLVQAQRDRNTALQRSLRSFVPRAATRAEEFERIAAQRDRATTVLRNLASTEATQSRGGPEALQFSFLAGGTEQSGITGSVPLRRGIAAGLAAALVVLGMLLLLARGRRLR